MASKKRPSRRAGQARVTGSKTKEQNFKDMGGVCPDGLGWIKRQDAKSVHDLQLFFIRFPLWTSSLEFLELPDFAKNFTYIFVRKEVHSAMSLKV